MSVQSERTERTFFSPAHAISVKVPKSALRGSLDTGLLKKDIFAQNLPIRINKRVIVEASEAGTNDSIFFAPEAPTVDISKSRVTPTQYIKARPCDHDDIVYSDEDFEISFVGMSITPHDRFGGNDILLCSLAKTDEPEANMSQDRPVEALGNAQTISNVSVVSEESSATMSVAEKQKLDKEMKLQKSLDNLPLSLQLGRRDIPFIHYDPVIDGHDIGKKPDTFVPIPGTKRLYKQRRHDGSKQRNNTEFVRFTVMEIDSLSDEQLQAVRDIEEITVSVSKAAATIPYLKVVSWMLKVANSLGKAALKKVASPDHVMSEDVKFQIARRNMPLQSQEYGNYLRYGYYYFLSDKIDAKLYVQTGASSQAAPLLMKRQGYKANLAKMNEKEYFVLTGVSYVAIKVSRGCSEVQDDRGEMLQMHRVRLAELLAKYKAREGDEV